LFNEAGRVNYSRDIEVERDDTKRPRILVNSHVPDEYFDLIRRAPAGTILVDPKTGQRKVIEQPSGL